MKFCIQPQYVKSLVSLPIKKAFIPTILAKQSSRVRLNSMRRSEKVSYLVHLILNRSVFLFQFLRIMRDMGLQFQQLD